MSTLFDMFGIVGVIFAGWVSDKYANSRRTGVSLCMLFVMVIGCSMLYFWGQTSIFGFGLCISIIGFSLYGPDALMTGAGAQDIGNIRGATLSAAVINGMGSVGAVSQEIIIGKLYDSSDGEMGPIFFLLMASACCSAFSLWIIRATKLSKV